MVEAARHHADELYTGDHWQSIREAYRLASRYSSRAELWVISAGYGLIRSRTLIKPYSATFATGAADSVWRGRIEGDRPRRLQDWWQRLGHESTLADLLPQKEDGVVIVAAGTAYVTALQPDLEAARQLDVTDDRFSVISAGTRGDGALLPVSGRFRTAFGGTDSALNARVLCMLASEATLHRFSRVEMAALLRRLSRDTQPTERQAGRSSSDQQIAGRIRAIRRDVPGASRTEALRRLRSDGIACEQVRFASIWSGRWSSESS
jgi:hypothetical protein